jgi:hypothetical protein
MLLLPRHLLMHLLLLFRHSFDLYLLLLEEVGKAQAELLLDHGAYTSHELLARLWLLGLSHSARLVLLLPDWENRI